MTSCYGTLEIVGAITITITIFPVLHFPVLLFGPPNSSPAFSTPVFRWSVIFQSCIFSRPKEINIDKEKIPVEDKINFDYCTYSSIKKKTSLMDKER